MSFPDGEYAKIIEDVSTFVRNEVITVATNITTTLRDIPANGGTPIDTGFARSNWIPTVGSPSGSVYGNKKWDKKSKRYIAEVDDSGAAGGFAQVFSWQIGEGDIYITNNVDYINVLDTTTHSKQQKPGFVYRAVQRALVGLRTKKGNT